MGHLKIKEKKKKEGTVEMERISKAKLKKKMQEMNKVCNMDFIMEKYGYKGVQGGFGKFRCPFSFPYLGRVMGMARRLHARVDHQVGNDCLLAMSMKR